MLNNVIKSLQEYKKKKGHYDNELENFESFKDKIIFLNAKEDIEGLLDLFQKNRKNLDNKETEIISKILFKNYFPLLSNALKSSLIEELANRQIFLKQIFKNHAYDVIINHNSFAINDLLKSESLYDAANSSTI